MLDQFFAFLGRTHPLVLHLPIGFLIALAALEAWAMLTRSREIDRHPVAPTPLVLLLALTGAYTAMCGILLSLEPAYSGDTLQLHQWLGITLGAFCLVLLPLHLANARGKAWGKSAYRAALLTAVIVALPAGHFGATLTHGAGFLTEPLRAKPAPRDPAPIARDPSLPSENPPTPGLAFAVLEAKCVSCHGERRQRGGLRLDTLEHILAGADAGPVVVATDPSQSELFRRISLPLAHDEHMPPDGREQLTADEIALLERWILEGANEPTGG